MSMEVINHDVTVDHFDQLSTISNKYSVKIVGLNVSEVSENDVLASVISYVNPKSITALMADLFNSNFALFLNDLQSVCILISTKIKICNFPVTVLPLVETYVIHGVYPFITLNELKDIFASFGTIVEMNQRNVLPNSEMFSHIQSCRREISFFLPNIQTELPVPEIVAHNSLKFMVKKLCLACSTEGHSLMKCPDLDSETVFDLCRVKSEASESCKVDSKSEPNTLDSSNMIEEKCHSSEEDVIVMEDLKPHHSSSDSATCPEPSLGLGASSNRRGSGIYSSDSDSSLTSAQSVNSCCRRTLRQLKKDFKNKSKREIMKFTRNKLRKSTHKKPYEVKKTIKGKVRK